MTPYDRILKKVKLYTNNENIVFSTSPFSLIIDDFKQHKCLLNVSNMYNAPYVTEGSMQDVGIDCGDLEALGILTPIFSVDTMINKEVLV